MEAAMRKLGIKSSQLDASRVIIEKSDGTVVIIENPSVTQVDMQGQQSFQITGTVSAGNLSPKQKGGEDEDVNLIMEKTGASREEAESALAESGGDIASAIEKLG